MLCHYNAFFCRTTKWMCMLWICKYYVATENSANKEEFLWNFVSECVRAFNNFMLRNWRFSSSFQFVLFSISYSMCSTMNSNKRCQDGPKCSIQFGTPVRKFYKRNNWKRKNAFNSNVLNYIESFVSISKKNFNKNRIERTICLHRTAAHIVYVLEIERSPIGIVNKNRCKVHNIDTRAKSRTIVIASFIQFRS